MYLSCMKWLISRLDERRLDPSISKIPRRPSTIHHHEASTADITIDVDSAASSPGIPKVCLKFYILVIYIGIGVQK